MTDRGEVKEKYEFCPMPPCAMRDPRLARKPTYLRVLMAVSYFDRMSATDPSREGCFANRKTLATITRLDLADLSRALRALIELGYLEFRKVGRRNIYRIAKTGVTSDMSDYIDESQFKR